MGKHTFFASLLYSSTKSSRFAISSVSDIKSPLFEVQVALLWRPLDVFLTGTDSLPWYPVTDGLGCRSGVESSRDALIVAKGV